MLKTSNSTARAVIRVVLGTMLIALFLIGCHSPENGRPRGGGPGADGGNYHKKPLHVPSKIDGSNGIPYPTAMR